MRRRPSAWAVASLCAAVGVAVAVFVYGRVIGLSYPEYSDFALWFGDHPWYSSLPVSEILGGYFHSTLGWYRPTSFLLVPYLLHLDYFSPDQIMIANLIGLVGVASLAPLFVTARRLIPSLLGAVVIICAPALYLIPYGSQIDSLYILFSMGFVAAFMVLWRSGARGRLRISLIAAGALSYLLAVTSKEIAVLAPALLVPVLLMLCPVPSWRAFRRALRWAAPFLLASGVLYFLVGRGGGDVGPYSRGLGIGRLSHAPDLIAWALGFPWPASGNANWIPDWPPWEVAVAGISLGLVAIAAVLGARYLRWWRIGLYTATFCALACLIALPGGLPHHTYPLVVMYGAAAAAAAGAAGARLGTHRSAAIAGVVFGLALLFAVTLNGRARFSDALYRGPHTQFFVASTELFYGSGLEEVASGENPLLIFQDCLGGLHNPLRYYARSGRGSQIIVRSDAEVRALLPTARGAQALGRDVFVARCRSDPPPYYSIIHMRPKAYRR